MTAPNIVNVTTINGNTAVLALNTTAQSIVTNSASSNKVYKINALYISNVNTVSSAVDVDLFRSSVAYRIAKGTILPTASSLDVISKPVYLLEGDSLRLTANSLLSVEAVCSWEEIS
jgi:hypothetical protein